MRGEKTEEIWTGEKRRADAKRKGYGNMSSPISRTDYSRFIDKNISRDKKDEPAFQQTSTAWVEPNEDVTLRLSTSIIGC